ncbi:GNAT family protein [Shewanella chilikensis]|uniref:GNAT family N-acetyltransferase n=1 Tax=Shewanella chilikensis TaxID=558541 RepID=UPI0030068E26
MLNVYLRELSVNDLTKLNEYRNEKKSIDFLGANFRYIDISNDVAWYEKYKNNRNNNVRLAICSEKFEGIIGVVYLLDIDWVNRNAEFAIWLFDDAVKGAGVGKFVTDMVLKHAVYDLNLHRVYLHVLESNYRAIKLYKTVGFETEGKLRDAIYKNGKYENIIIMSFLSSKFDE